MPKRIDQTGHRYGKLLVIRKATKQERQAAGIYTGGTCWVCKCDCGNIRLVLGTRLRNDHVTMCEECQKKILKPYHPLQNLIGKKFNHWTVIGYAKERSEHERRGYWLCQCDCEDKTIQTVRGDQLKSGKSTECGKCLRKKKVDLNQTKVIDLTGKQFGRLTVLKRDSNRTKDGRVKWICQCSCQNHTIVSVDGSSLRSGGTRSCGCLQREKARELGKKRLIDLTGKKFGHLTVLSLDHQQDHDPVWLCECDCNLHTKVKVLGYNLKNGHTQSCGLCQKGHSRGEEKVAKLLKNNEIPFLTEQTVKINNSNHRFDFYVNNSYFIEYDGIGHYKATGGVWNTEEEVQNRQQRDKIKNQWCKNNNIPLIRIPYTHLKDLCIDDLKLETTKFRVD